MAITLHHPHFSSAKASAQWDAWTASVAASVRRGLQSTWIAMQAYGEQRARQHMDRLASNYDCTAPELAARMRAASRSISA